MHDEWDSRSGEQSRDRSQLDQALKWRREDATRVGQLLVEESQRTGLASAEIGDGCALLASALQVKSEYIDPNLKARSLT